MQTAPICLFAFNRPGHTKKTLAALESNELADQSELYVFVDGPRLGSANEAADIRNIAEVVSLFNGSLKFKSVHLIQKSKNQGLAQSIIQGVTAVIEKHGSIIVLEDDIVTSPAFLSYMNQGLQLYQNDPRVASIHAYIYPTKQELPESFFLRGADCWGWATWTAAWSVFEPDGAKLLSELKAQDLTRSFDYDDSYPYTQMLMDQINGRVNSWAIRWYASAYLRNMLTLYPGKSYIRNIGNDGSGTHSMDSVNFDIAELNDSKTLAKIPIQENYLGRNAFVAYFRGGKKQSFFQRLQSKISKYLNT